MWEPSPRDRTAHRLGRLSHHGHVQLHWDTLHHMHFHIDHTRLEAAAVQPASLDQGGATLGKPVPFLCNTLAVHWIRVSNPHCLDRHLPSLLSELSGGLRGEMRRNSTKSW